MTSRKKRGAKEKAKAASFAALLAAERITDKKTLQKSTPDMAEAVYVYYYAAYAYNCTPSASFAALLAAERITDKKNFTKE
ncbi:hypothetical protein F2Q70_00043974 [Brassica cretica]|uniref:Uncharacterized protein n=1 Tax=Brassica cretica TaxID=69181 RepID=A0A8S9KLS7_BRACR|nr:hypothetical protein F2Q70_00043974 [Brassica cretica]